MQLSERLSHMFMKTSEGRVLPPDRLKRHNSVIYEGDAGGIGGERDLRLRKNKSVHEENGLLPSLLPHVQEKESMLRNRAFIERLRKKA